ncbi:protein CNGC15b isoform X1 [Hevea brasiliensis]|uniref:protein CNGC15b isoform X1 n=2 Tax=Hevea brasiliensis TaxID=3981 RepID=UPI0025D9DC8A|nr:protein CNGC15b isoform X1 [Hevea brasiliensis]
MGRFGSSRHVRVEAEPRGLDDLQGINGVEMTKLRHRFNVSQVPDLTSRKDITDKAEKTSKVLHRVFSEDYEKEKNKILDPRGKILHMWNKIFLGACLLSIFVDPLFFYLPIIRKELCIEIAVSLKKVLTLIRSLLDVFYVIHIIIRFHTAYVAPSSRVVGRGELVIDSSKIALSYLRKSFLLDLFAALPIPQIFAWVILPNLEGVVVTKRRDLLWLILVLQYVPRICLLFPLSSQIIEGAGVVSKKARTGAAYNLLLFMLTGHASGAWWYLLSMERQEDCWKSACNLENPQCQIGFFDCRMVEDPHRIEWFKSSNVTSQCDPNNNLFPFGIYSDAVIYNVQGLAFLRKYFYCLWWGLKNLSTLGQSFTTSIDIGENIFVIILVTLGLILLALLIGNMQRYLQSTTIRLEEWKIKRTDTEHWMHHRHLPPDLRQIVRKYDLYKWLSTKGVDEESLVKSLPTDLQRKVKNHLCFDLLRRVPLFNQMDETMLDAICERLKAALCTRGMFLMREGDPVNQMVFIIRGRLDSYTANGGRAGFLDSYLIGPGDFCGEELVTWALDPRSNIPLPSSTRTIKAITEVEAFALVAEDLKFVASQFRRVNSKQLRHKFRFYSHQWRTWAACSIQAAWRRHKEFKRIAELGGSELEMQPPRSFWDRYAESLIESTRRNIKHKQQGLEKPAEPDFLAD